MDLVNTTLPKPSALMVHTNICSSFIFVMIDPFDEYEDPNRINNIEFFPFTRDCREPTEEDMEALEEESCQAVPKHGSKGERIYSPYFLDWLRLGGYCSKIETCRRLSARHHVWI